MSSVSNVPKPWQTPWSESELRAWEARFTISPGTDEWSDFMYELWEQGRTKEAAETYRRSTQGITQTSYMPRRLPSECPSWLCPGVEVQYLSVSKRHRKGVVIGVRWPWLVFLEGELGAINPSRIRKGVINVSENVRSESV